MIKERDVGRGERDNKNKPRPQQEDGAQCLTHQGQHYFICQPRQGMRQQLLFAAFFSCF
ncbi:hypothetical protein PANT111_120074 [Pantoea brenneri]|uniref:Uncharacterized protein n=1 Tax=Pantoea brenneri TaxID=472694 RepID=A0AAX3J146_9GAMM|nr:hypothetical protein PANT111_120074 [Pantoea brenneri]